MPHAGGLGQAVRRRALLLVALACAGLPGVPRTALADLPDVVARVKPAVVVVGTFRSLDNPRFRLRGTGFVVGRGNTVITSRHVLPGPAEDQTGQSLMVQVRGADQELSLRQATVLETDLVHDLVALRIEGNPVPALALRDSDTVREGQAVGFTGFPIGAALGYVPVTHRGIVSAITPAVLPAPSARQLSESAVRAARSGGFDLFQLDAMAYPGNSGGPLFDAATGEVIGVISMVLIKDTRESTLNQPSGITYAVPSKFVAQLLARVGVR